MATLTVVKKKPAKHYYVKPGGPSEGLWAIGTSRPSNKPKGWREVSKSEYESMKGQAKKKFGGRRTGRGGRGRGGVTPSKHRYVWHGKEVSKEQFQAMQTEAERQRKEKGYYSITDIEKNAPEITKNYLIKKMESSRTESEYNKWKKGLEKQGYEIKTGEELIKEGYTDVEKDKSYIVSKERPTYIRGKEVPVSPSIVEKLGLITPEEAEEARKKGAVYIVTPEIIKKAVEFIETKKGYQEQGYKILSPTKAFNLGLISKTSFNKMKGTGSYVPATADQIAWVTMMKTKYAYINIPENKSAYDVYREKEMTPYVAERVKHGKFTIEIPLGLPYGGQSTETMAGASITKTQDIIREEWEKASLGEKLVSESIRQISPVVSTVKTVAPGVSTKERIMAGAQTGLFFGAPLITKIPWQLRDIIFGGLGTYGMYKTYPEAMKGEPSAMVGFGLSALALGGAVIDATISLKSASGKKVGIDKAVLRTLSKTKGKTTGRIGRVDLLTKKGDTLKGWLIGKESKGKVRYFVKTPEQRGDVTGTLYKTMEVGYRHKDFVSVENAIKNLKYTKSQRTAISLARSGREKELTIKYGIADEIIRKNIKENTLVFDRATRFVDRITMERGFVRPEGTTFVKGYSFTPEDYYTYYLLEKPIEQTKGWTYTTGGGGTTGLRLKSLGTSIQSTMQKLNVLRQLQDVKLTGIIRTKFQDITARIPFISGTTPKTVSKPKAKPTREMPRIEEKMAGVTPEVKPVIVPTPLDVVEKNFNTATKTVSASLDAGMRGTGMIKAKPEETLPTNVMRSVEEAQSSTEKTIAINTANVGRISPASLLPKETYVKEEQRRRFAPTMPITKVKRKERYIQPLTISQSTLLQYQLQMKKQMERLDLIPNTVMGRIQKQIPEQIQRQERATMQAVEQAQKPMINMIRLPTIPSVPTEVIRPPRIPPWLWFPNINAYMSSGNKAVNTALRNINRKLMEAEKLI